MADKKAMKIAELLKAQKTPMLEDMFQSWALENRVPQSNDYDMRGYFMGKITGDPAASSSVDPSDLQLHFTDKWKMPNHPSFSNESMYDMTGQAPGWVENPAPYTEGTWAQQGRKGLMNIQMPFGKGK